MINFWVFLYAIAELAHASQLSISEVELSAVHNASFFQPQSKVKYGAKYAFFRSMDVDKSIGSSRRVFGGAAVELSEFPAVCALLDRHFSVRCSAMILNNYWVLTAAHCVTPKLAYVKYNTRQPTSNDGNVSSIQYLYRHPNYKVVQQDDGRGIDVKILHNDVGLVRTRDEMQLATPTSFFSALRRNNPLNLYNKKIKVLGFGRTERSVLGEELFSVNLQLVSCDKSDWVHCICGLASEKTPRGVCSGDSGGPVLYQGSPMGVTSMGPVECTRSGGILPLGATSVFTSLYQYADVINATIQNTEKDLRMRMISRAAGYSPLRLLFSVLLLLPSAIRF